MAKSSLIKPLGIGTSNVRELAALLRSKGRGRDTILAHINPEEAALLKARGGSGRINPNTGLPEFDDTQLPTPDMTGFTPGADISNQNFTPSQGAVSTQASTPNMQGFNPGADISNASYTPSQGAGTSTTATPAAGVDAVTGGFGNITNLPTGASIPTSVWNNLTPEQQNSALTPQAPEPGIGKQITDYLNANPWATRMAGAGISIIPGLIQAQKAKDQAAQLQQQYNTLGQPFQQQGSAVMAAGLRGELTPANQNAFEAAQAQALQGVANRGMVGATGVSNQLAQVYSNLAAQQVNQGMQLLQIGDNYVQAGITAGIQANTALNQSMTALYAQVGNMVAGTRSPIA
jgi:hypothetical protein